MNKYRFVTRLLPEQVDELKRWLTRKDLNESTRIRLRSILRSHEQYTMDEIAELEGVNRDTVSLWITQWETYGIEGLSTYAKLIWYLSPNCCKI
jgi:DNA-directed RNA polymerase sigma subunit (sigma70/sigma32)